MRDYWPVGAVTNHQLRPRDIQARLRLGDAPEDLAAQTDMSLEQIRRFARPVLSEIADVITRVQQHKVVGSAGTETVGKLAATRLAARGVAANDLQWSARRDSGAPWVVELKFDGGAGKDRVARWTFDRKLNILTALDDDARWLCQGDEPITQPLQDVPSLAGRREAKAAQEVPPPPPVEPAVSGAPAPYPATGLSASTAAPHARNTRTGATRRIPARRGRAGTATGPDIAGIVSLNQWQAAKTETTAIPVLETPNRSAAPAPAAAARSEFKVLTPVPAPASGDSASDPGAAAKGSKIPTGRKAGRAQVPSWDEIVFGSRD